MRSEWRYQLRCWVLKETRPPLTECVDRWGQHSSDACQLDWLSQELEEIREEGPTEGRVGQEHEPVRGGGRVW